MSFIFTITNAYLAFHKVCSRDSTLYLKEKLEYSCSSSVGNDHNKFKLALLDQLMRYDAERARTNSHDDCKNTSLLSSYDLASLLPECHLKEKNFMSLKYVMIRFTTNQSMQFTAHDFTAPTATFLSAVYLAGTVL